MPSLSPPRRAVAIASWLVIAGVLVRIAVAEGTFMGVGEPVSAGAIVEIAVGVGLLAVALALVAGFARGASWSVALALAAGLVAVPYGLALLLASHESGALLSLAGLVGLIARGGGLPARRPPG